VNAPTSDFSGTINWGDGTAGNPDITNFTSSAVTGSGGSYAVGASHQYAEDATYNVTVTINDDGGSQAIDTGSTTVADAPLTKGTITILIPGVAHAAATQISAAFTDANLNAPTSDFSGTINWGDGTSANPDITNFTSSAVTGSGGSYTVAADHQYAGQGTYPITVVINDGGGKTATDTGSTTVAENVGLLVLDPSGSGALTVTGNGGITVNNGGDVVVDSSNTTAAALTGNGGVSAANSYVTGGTKVTGKGNFTPKPIQRTAIADPLGLPLPTPPATSHNAVNYSGSATDTLSPGTYVGGITNSGSGNIVLLPGVYYLKGGGLQILNNGSIGGTDVLIINAPGTTNAGINLSGNGSLNLTAGPLPSGYAAYQGITIMQDPASTAPIHLSGGGNLVTDGVIYAPRAMLTISGAGGVFDSTDTTAPAAEVIVGDVDLTGNGPLVVNAEAPATSPSIMALPNATQVSFSSFTTSANVSVPGQPVTLTATLTSSAVPGVVDFFDQTTDLDLGSVTLSGGTASLTTSALTSLGNQVIDAYYIAASPSFRALAPDALTQVVQSEAVEGTTLFVGGTASANQIQVQLNNNQVVVNQNGVSPNYQTPLAGLTALVVYDQGLNANIQVANNVTLPAVLYAGNGAGFQIQGGGGPTVEVGGSGGGGTLKGGQGRNILIAGAGGANLQGGNAGSILIGGYTDYDQNLAALEAALAEWNSNTSNGLAALATTFTTSTVHSDGQADQLQGGGGNAALDWFFASTLDKINGSNSFDQITTIT
jgi:hypothetical protein